MGVELLVEDLPPSPVRAYDHHVHTEITRVRAADPRQPSTSRHEPVVLTRRPDRLTPLLLAACAEGRRLSKVAIRATDGDEHPVFRIEMARVYVISVLTSFGDEGPVETVTLDYGAVSWHWDGADTVQAAWEVHPPPEDG
ncbi:MAG: type VI secretion system tube protein Hcp [Myxococcales bacterium]|nr:type VI secretion system tube protein Hcp [Myxococcales bacterium]